MTERFTIDQLCERFGLKRRTVRFYVQERLLPPPAGRGRGGFYDERHASILKMIVELRAKGAGIPAIREYLATSLGRQAVEEMAREPEKGFGEVLGRIAEPGRRTPNVASEACIRFLLPDGVELVVPQELDAAAWARVRELLKHAGSILSGEEEEW